MSLYDINYRCGHTCEEQIYGTNVRGEREREKERRETRLCPDCYRQQKRDQEESALDGIELPELSGSSKQSAWAADIRRRTLAQCTLDERAVTTARQITSAKWWIDNRDHQGGAAVTAFLSEIPPSEEEIQLKREKASRCTRAILNREERAQLDDPRWEKGRGTKRPHPLFLPPAPALALRIWKRIMNAKATDKPPTAFLSGTAEEAGSSKAVADAIESTGNPSSVDMQVVDEWLGSHDDPVAADLLYEAVCDAMEREPVGWWELQGVEWDYAHELHRRYRELVPPPDLSPAPRQEPRECQHGVSYSEPCDECGE